MNVQDKINAIRKLLKLEAENVVFGEATLQDGTVVKWEGELQIGTALFVIGEEGEVPAPNGTHTVEDGTQVVTEGGIVTDIIAPQAEVEAKAAVTPEEQTAIITEVMQILEPRIAALEEALMAKAEAFEAMTTENNELKSQLESFKNDVVKTNEQFAAVLEKIAQNTVHTPAKPVEHAFKAVDPIQAEAIAMASFLTSKNKN
jgi:preprotein translocase subunit YajC/ribosomal protein S15P/S13E